MRKDKLDCYPKGTIIRAIFEYDYFEKVGKSSYTKLENLENGDLKLTDEDVSLDDKKEYEIIWIG